MRARDAAAELCSDILHKMPQFVSAEPDFDFEHPVNSFDITLDGKKVGFLSVPHPVVLENVDKKCAVAFFELYTEAFAATAEAAVKYKEPSKFPAIEIDMTFTADVGAIEFTSLTNAAKAAAGDILSDVVVKDIYTADGVSAITLRFFFVSSERTLTKQELAPATDKIAAALTEQGIVLKA